MAVKAETNPSRLIPLNRWNDFHLWPENRNVFYQLVFHQKTNGLAEYQAIARAGRKILIDEQRFLDWVRNHHRKA